MIARLNMEAVEITIADVDPFPIDLFFGAAAQITVPVSEWDIRIGPCPGIGQLPAWGNFPGKDRTERVAAFFSLLAEEEDG